MIFFNILGIGKKENSRKKAIREGDIHQLYNGPWIDLHHHPMSGDDVVVRYRVISVDREKKVIRLRPERPAKQQEDLCTDSWSFIELGISLGVGSKYHPTQYITISETQN